MFCYWTSRKSCETLASSQLVPMSKHILLTESVSSRMLAGSDQWVDDAQIVSLYPHQGRPSYIVLVYTKRQSELQTASFAL